MLPLLIIYLIIVLNLNINLNITPFLLIPLITLTLLTGLHNRKRGIRLSKKNVIAISIICISGLILFKTYGNNTVNPLFLVCGLFIFYYLNKRKFKGSSLLTKLNLLIIYYILYVSMFTNSLLFLIPITLLILKKHSNNKLKAYLLGFLICLPVTILQMNYVSICFLISIILVIEFNPINYIEIKKHLNQDNYFKTLSLSSVIITFIHFLKLF